MSDYHARIMNIPTDTESMSSYPPGGVSLRAYLAGHRDARHAAAVIALEAQAEVERRDLAYEDLKREYDHKCERVDTLQARVTELEGGNAELMRQLDSLASSYGLVADEAADEDERAALAAVDTEKRNDDWQEVARNESGRRKAQTSAPRGT